MEKLHVSFPSDYSLSTAVASVSSFELISNPALSEFKDSAQLHEKVPPIRGEIVASHLIK